MINKVRKYFADSDKSIIFVIQKWSRTCRIGKLIKLNEIPRLRFILQWRATPSGSTTPSGSIYAGGLQRRWALKSCLSEFRHASGTALPFSVLFQTDYSLLIIHY